MIDPLNDGISSVKVIQQVGSDKGIVNAARISFANYDQSSFTEGDYRLIKYLWSHEHGSPFEHNLITFLIKCPIFVDRQFVRHRIGVSKNEESGRYTEIVPEFYTPSDFRTQSRSNRQASVDVFVGEPELVSDYRQHCIAAQNLYASLLAAGVTREQARGVLPQAQYTSSYYTFNLRSLIHFLNLRDHVGAQWETQQYAQAMGKLAEQYWPQTFNVLNGAEYNRIQGE